MFENGHLSDSVTVVCEGAEYCIKVRLHLCNDMKLVALVSGLGGASSGRPCFLCHWERAHPTAVGLPRTIAGCDELATWSKALQQPIMIAGVLARVDVRHVLGFMP